MAAVLTVTFRVRGEARHSQVKFTREDLAHEYAKLASLRFGYAEVILTGRRTGSGMVGQYVNGAITPGFAAHSEIALANGSPLNLKLA